MSSDLPKNVKLPLVAVASWYGAVPVDVTGAKPFQSIQPAPLTARLASASSKPLWSAIVPLAPQPVEARSGDVVREQPKSERLEPKNEFAGRCCDARRACPWARESTWVELIAFRAADATPTRCCAT